MDELANKLVAIVGSGGVLSHTQVAERSAGALRSDNLRARLLVRPRTTSEIAAVLRLCNEMGQGVVTHGGLTGLVHGADASEDEIILSTERMTGCELDPVQRVALVEAGVKLQTLQEAASAQGLFFPLDLGARGSCSIGGNVATNAGGNRVIRYGMMRDLVLGLEAVLADGTVVSSLNRMIKNNAGYDLKQLFVGSEGTLGVITRVVVRLFEQPKSQDVALVAINDFAAMTIFLKEMDAALGGALSAFEAMWQSFYRQVTTPPDEVAKTCSSPGGDELGKGRVPPLPDRYPYYVLVEAQGAHPLQDADRFEAALSEALAKGLIADAIIARSERERAALWALRDDVLQIARDGVPVTFDVSLPIAAMEDYLVAVNRGLAAWPEHKLWVWGHLGDGNLHIAVLAKASREAIEELVYGPLAAIGGSVSAEHGVGLEKKPYLAISRHAAEIALMQKLKATLDPRQILNRGKLF